MSMIDKARKRVREHYFEKLRDAGLEQLRNAALGSLYFGPYAVGDLPDECPNWPGYEKACKALEAWASENLQEVWYDYQTDEVRESKPEPWDDGEGNTYEPIWEEYVHFDTSDIKRLVFKELVGNGM